MSKVVSTCRRCGDTVSVHRARARQRISFGGGWMKLQLRPLSGESTSVKALVLCPNCVRGLMAWVDGHVPVASED